MSRSGASDVLVVSCEVTSNSRKIGRAPCQSGPRADSARSTLAWLTSHTAWIQNGSGTISTRRSLVRPGLDRVVRSFSGAITGSGLAVPLKAGMGGVLGRGTGFGRIMGFCVGADLATGVGFVAVVGLVAGAGAGIFLVATAGFVGDVNLAAGTDGLPGLVG